MGANGTEIHMLEKSYWDNSRFHEVRNRGCLKLVVVDLN